MDQNKKISQNSTMFGYLMIFIAGILWGTEGYFVSKMGAMGATPFLTGFSGHFFALLPLLIFILATKGIDGLKISKRGLVFAIILGILTKAFFKMAYNSAIKYAGVTTSAVLVTTATIWVALMSAAIFKEKFYANNYIAILINVIGVFMIVTLGDLSAINIVPLGIFLGILAAFLNACSTIIAKIAATEDDPITMTFYMILVSSIVLTIVAQPWKAENIALFKQGDFLLLALVLGLLTGAIGNVCYFKGLATDMDASKAPVIASVDVIVSALIGTIAFNEGMNLIGVIGIAIIIISIILMNKPKNKNINKAL